MGLETNAQTIPDLNELYPTTNDGISQGDNHIRLIKRVVKNTFRNLTGPIDAEGVIKPRMIVMFSGTEEEVPSGWAICDGENGTPNLTERMILGSGPSRSVGDTGGVATNVLEVEQLPTHSHGAGEITVGGGSHTHTGTTDEDGLHVHSIDTKPNDENRNTGYIERQGEDGSPVKIDTNPAGEHTHTFTTDEGAEHSHDVSGQTAETGEGGSINNLPPFYVLAFIMKL